MTSATPGQRLPFRGSRPVRLAIGLVLVLLLMPLPTGRVALGAATTVDPGTAATPATTTSVGVTVVATKSSVALTGAWATVVGSGYTGGRALRSSQAGATLRYTFTGTQVTLVGPKYSRGGTARVYLDGHYVKTAFEYSSWSQARVTLYARSFATTGRHTIAVIVTRGPFTVNAITYRRLVAVAATAPNVVTVGPSESVSAFRALAANTSVDVIEMAAGTYHGWREANLPDRTGHPLTIRPVAGATVVFDAAGDSNYPDHAFGMLNASYITLDGTPGRFVFQHYLLAQDGMFLLMNASHITIKGLTFTNIAGNSNTNSQSTHLFYIAGGVSYLTIEDVTASHITAADEPGGVYTLSGLQFYTGGSGAPATQVTVKYVSITGADWGIVVRNGATGMLFDGIRLVDCGHGGVDAALDLGLNNTGTVLNSTTTSSAGTPAILGRMANGGGNSFH